MESKHTTSECLINLIEESKTNGNLSFMPTLTDDLSNKKVYSQIM